MAVGVLGYIPVLIIDVLFSFFLPLPSKDLLIILVLITFLVKF